MSVRENVSAAIDFLRRRKRDYQLTFNPLQPAHYAVLEDLAKFCRAAETCVVRNADGSIDDKRTLTLEGRREVWLRIQQHLRLTEEQLFGLYSGNPAAVTTERA